MQNKRRSAAQVVTQKARSGGMEEDPKHSGAGSQVEPAPLLAEVLPPTGTAYGQPGLLQRAGGLLPQRDSQSTASKQFVCRIRAEAVPHQGSSSDTPGQFV